MGLLVCNLLATPFHATTCTCQFARMQMPTGRTPVGIFTKMIEHTRLMKRMESGNQLLKRILSCVMHGPAGLKPAGIITSRHNLHMSIFLVCTCLLVEHLLASSRK